LFFLNTAHTLFFGDQMNYTINTLDQLKPILTEFRKYNTLSQKTLAEKFEIKNHCLFVGE